MPVKIMIVDPVATNRIVLKVKLMAAFYEVKQATSSATALAQVKVDMPDLVLLGSGLTTAEASAFLTGLKPALPDAQMPVMAILPSTNPETRQMLLEHGADDVLERPLDDLIMLARLRCLLRANQAERELRLRDGTRRALGLAESASTFEMPPSINLTGNDAAAATRLGTALKRAMPGAVIRSDLQNFLRGDGDKSAPDVFVVMITKGRTDNGLSLISNIRAQPGLRHATILAIAPRDTREAAAAALDHGADDLVPDDVAVKELALRLRRLTARKRTSEKLRQTVQSGLHAAMTDPLTGLYNRRYALPHLQRLAERCSLSGRTFAVMIADLDHFKRVNDQYGHAAGDAVLVETANRLTNGLRPVDLVSRIGGEEFLIAMPETDHTAARATAERLCRLIADTSFTVPGNSAKIRVTASIGVVLGSSESADLPSGIADLMERADHALYGSKSLGRNQFTVARSAA